MQVCKDRPAESECWWSPKKANRFSEHSSNILGAFRSLDDWGKLLARRSDSEDSGDCWSGSDRSCFPLEPQCYVIKSHLSYNYNLYNLLQYLHYGFSKVLCASGIRRIVTRKPFHTQEGSWMMMAISMLYQHGLPPSIRIMNLHAYTVLMQGLRTRMQTVHVETPSW